MYIRSSLVILVLCAAGAVAQTNAQSQPPAQEPAPESTPAPAQTEPPEGTFHQLLKRMNFGVAVRGSRYDLIYNGRSFTTTTVNPAATNDYNTTSTAKRIAFGPSVDYVYNDRFIVSTQFLHQSVNYIQTVKTTRTIDSGITNVTENTRATYWDIPVMLRAFSLHRYQPRWMFVTLGAQARLVSNIKTGNEYSYPTGVTAYNETSAKPQHSFIPGAIGGLGFRFSDDYHIKIVPEVRYVRWLGSTFNSQTTKSRTDGLEIVVGISY